MWAGLLVFLPVKKRMHSRKQIEQGNDHMTEPEPGEPEDYLMEGDEYLIGGIELHAQIVQEDVKPKITFTFRPTTHDREIPGWIAEFNTVLEEICRVTVAAFPDPDYFSRFYSVLKKDGLTDRCWYWLKVTARPSDDDRVHDRISDAIDPDLLRADPHVTYRAKKARAMVKRSMREVGRGVDA